MEEEKPKKKRKRKAAAEGDGTQEKEHKKSWPTMRALRVRPEMTQMTNLTKYSKSCHAYRARAYPVRVTTL